MNKSLIKFWDKIVVLLLFIFGIIASCEKPKPQPEYGVPVPPETRDTNVCCPMYGVIPAPFTE